MGSIRFYKPDDSSKTGGAWMKVTVKFYTHLRDLVGNKSVIELDLEEGATISHLLEELLQDSLIRSVLLEENQEIKSEITILKNGREIKFLEGMETVLESGDEIAVFPAVAGGQIESLKLDLSHRFSLYKIKNRTV